MPTLVLVDLCPDDGWLYKYLDVVGVYVHSKMLIRGVVGGGYSMRVVNGLSWGSIVIGKLQLMGCDSRGFLFARKRKSFRY